VLQMKLPDNCIVSLSGSNPLHRDAMQWIRSFGKVIFLDTHYSDILARLSSMKVDRIVGHGSDLVDNLKYRQQFYEGRNVISVKALQTRLRLRSNVMTVNLTKAVNN